MESDIQYKKHDREMFQDIIDRFIWDTDKNNEWEVGTQLQIQG